MAVAVTETSHDRPGPPTADSVGSRIVGVDIARGLALIGMFTVHVAISSRDPQQGLPDLMDWWLWAPSGRASVMFMLLAGVSLSIIRKRKKASSTDAAIRIRGLVLLVGGLLLTNTLWPASILEHYGMLFLIAPWLLTMRSRTLAGVAAAGLVGGPILLLLGSSQSDLASTPQDAQGALAWVYDTLHSLWFSGYYPLVVWLGIFAVGILVGRLDLGSKGVGLRLVAGGVAAVLLVAGVVGAFAAAGIEPEAGDDSEFTFDANTSRPIIGLAPDTEVELDSATLDSCLAGEGDFFSPGDCIDAQIVDAAAVSAAKAGDASLDSAVESSSWADLLDTSAHSGRIAWAVESTGISLAILGLLLLAPAAITTLLRPLAMLGSISLTAYLVHIALVTDIYQPHVEASDLSVAAQFAALIGLQLLLILMAVVIRRFWSRGPFEWLIKQVTGMSPTRRLSTPLSTQIGKDL